MRASIGTVLTLVLLGGGGVAHAQERTASTQRTVTTERHTSSAAETAPVADPLPQTEDEPAEEEDSDGHNILWIEAIGGYSFVNLRALSYSNLYPEIVEVKDTGVSGGLAAGLHFLFLDAGIRGVVSHYSSFDVGTVALEVGLRLPTPIISPFVRAHFGYAWNGSVNYANPGLTSVSVYGFTLGGALGLDIVPSDLFSIGAGLNVEILNLSRSQLDTNPSGVTNFDFTVPGSAVGIQVRGQIQATFHFF
ncbi:MAG: hypothetical protein IPK60_18990 [Sandaracinaceae bacterium]|nr:hypothetical protein [Sandaracinaceae bacterium]